MQILRPYQQTALDAVRTQFASGHRRVILTLPTGAGKTTIIAEMIRLSVARGGTVLCVAHRRELIGQLSDRLTNHGVPDHGIIMAGVPPTVAAVQVASIQTLARREKPPATFLVVDECHHAVSISYEQLLDAYPTAKVVGLTATPRRLDHRGLGDVFDSLVVGSTPRQLLAAGFLSPYRGKAFRKPEGLDQVKTVAGDYDVAGLATIYERPKILGDIVDQWMAFARPMRTIAFVPSIKASLDLVERMKAHTTAEHLDYMAPKAERAAILSRLRSGETRFISNVALLGEGIDIPELECCVMARPTKSLALYLQCVGRCARPAPGKQYAYLLDHGDCVARHGHPYEDHEWSLETTKPKKTAESPLRSCPECFAILEGSPTECPECGAVLRRERKPHETDKRVVAVDIDEGPTFEALLVKHRALGHPPGWAIGEWRSLGHESIPWGAWRKFVEKGKGAPWKPA